MPGNNIKTGAAYVVKYLLTDLERIGLQSKISYQWYIDVQ